MTRGSKSKGPRPNSQRTRNTKRQKLTHPIDNPDSLEYMMEGISLETTRLPLISKYSELKIENKPQIVNVKFWDGNTENDGGINLPRQYAAVDFITNKQDGPRLVSGCYYRYEMTGTSHWINGDHWVKVFEWIREPSGEVDIQRRKRMSDPRPAATSNCIVGMAESTVDINLDDIWSLNNLGY